ncbi:hypothetical protein [Actinomadura fibrosa]|uniref:Uncharacterized protein n=1 Tax=Actinomadura fibrosa TaxID=111802 RepID=A0ABW2XUI8_9ACTN|nr:hypothetical protein [Actinomadura fibrosa]
MPCTDVGEAARLSPRTRVFELGWQSQNEALLTAKVAGCTRLLREGS